ncbi:Permease of the drug/metabolite transporter (DMT) superfamily [Arboricoccus pini]|uniref:Permease of the drug/metabolite transporter (DMT) superfamily n=1 Tax=Arboricoccus pini TaxID=1963835 RepID=A0A212RZ89_9PROT|nr:DMT family transporter [Arboricoccus pini]SNB78153.1 Permease of the drug/metabolite transporter (DMT) superfamily [Arboricoccus pini]
MSEVQAVQVRGALDARAMSWLLLLCMAWGAQQVVIKLALPTVPPLWQISLRSLIPAFLIIAWARLRGENVLVPDKSLKGGLVLGLVFTIEFLLVYQGTARTTASRSVMFFYTAPFFVSLGAHFTIPAERLSRRQAGGLLLAFAGVLVAVGDGLRLPQWHEILGDLMVLMGAALWAVTTLMSRLTALRFATPARLVFYQMAVSAILSPLSALAAGQPLPLDMDLKAALSILYQSVGVSFVTYIVWFWLVRHYPASRLSSFTFLTPVLGMAASALVLGEPLTPLLLLALALICGGIYLVNRRGPGEAEATPRLLRGR